MISLFLLIVQDLQILYHVFIGVEPVLLFGGAYLIYLCVV